MSEDNVINIDDVRYAEDVVKQRFGAEHVVIAAVLKNGEFQTFIPTEISDIELVYIIETLKDRRALRVKEINEA